MTVPPAASPTPVRLSKVTLTKEAPSVSLTKQGGTSGALRVNLNWQMRKQFSGWGGKRGRAVATHADLDLDLCALYELSDGRKGVVQALGNAFGSLYRPRTSISTATTAPAPWRAARTSPSTSTTSRASAASSSS